jgi:Protein tyrosine and serine/threonine kinase/Galactose oxidase, central domain
VVSETRNRSNSAAASKQLSEKHDDAASAAPPVPPRRHRVGGGDIDVATLSPPLSPRSLATTTLPSDSLSGDEFSLDHCNADELVSRLGPHAVHAEQQFDALFYGASLSPAVAPLSPLATSGTTASSSSDRSDEPDESSSDDDDRDRVDAGGDASDDDDDDDASDDDDDGRFKRGSFLMEKWGDSSDSLRWVRADTWGDRPSARFHHTATRLRNAVYVFGGRDENWSIKGALYRLDLRTMEWKKMRVEGEMPSHRYGHSATAVAGGRYMFVIGGRTRTEVLGDVHIYDADENRWRRAQTTGEQMSARAHHAAVAWDRADTATSVTASSDVFKHLQAHIVVSGGEDGSNGNSLSDLYALSTASLHWRRLSLASRAPLLRRSSHSMTLLTPGKHALLFGGVDAQRKRKFASTRIHRDPLLVDLVGLGPAEKVCSSIPMAHKPPRLHSHAAVSLGRQVIMHGGYGRNGLTDRLMLFDVAGSELRMLAPLGKESPGARAWHTLTLVAALSHRKRVPSQLGESVDGDQCAAAADDDGDAPVIRTSNNNDRYIRSIMLFGGAVDGGTAAQPSVATDACYFLMLQTAAERERQRAEHRQRRLRQQEQRRRQRAAAATQGGGNASSSSSSSPSSSSSSFGSMDTLTRSPSGGLRLSFIGGGSSVVGGSWRRHGSRILARSVDLPRLPALIDMLRRDVRYAVLPSRDKLQVDDDKVLGRGASGVVRLAKLDARVVVLKEFYENDEGNGGDAGDETRVNEFAVELNIMRQLAHDNIVQLVGIVDAQPRALIMEYLPLGSLFDFIHEQPERMSWPLMLRFALDIVDGLEYLHSKQILHRDLKSSNACLASLDPKASGACLKLVDFGDACIASASNVRHTGTVRWCSVEVLRGDPYSEKTDVFSLAVVLWELIYRALPFDHCRFDSQVEDEVLAGARPPLDAACPSALRMLIASCWHENPAQRPTCSEIRACLCDVSAALHARQSLPPMPDVATK